MQLAYFFYLACRRITFKRVRAIIFAIPFIFIVALFVAITNWAINLQIKLQTELIEPAKQQQTLLTAETVQSGQSESFLSDSQLTDPITKDQVSKINAIAGVTHTSELRNVPYSSFISLDGIHINSASTVLTSLNDSVASLFGVRDFDFTPGKPIPIIVGQGAFTDSYVHFSGKETVDIPVRGEKETSADRQARPIKATLHRELMNTSVVGMKGTLTIPLMPSQPKYTYNQVQRGGEYIDIYSHITQEQLAAYNASTTAVWMKYWDVNALQKPLSIPVIVVGVNKSNLRTSSYIPPAAVTYISQLVRDRYETARNSTLIPNTVLTHSQGILLTDNTLKVWPSSYLTNIPDLRTISDIPSQLPIISRYISGKDDTVVLQELKHFVFTENNMISNSNLVEIDNQSDIREIAAKISSGTGLITYNDSILGTYGEIMGLVLPIILIILGIILLVSVISISILAWVYTADSVREVGILRSLGTTRLQSNIFVILQLALIAFISMLIGFTLGLLINLYAASSVLAILDTQTAISRSLSSYNVVLTSHDISQLNIKSSIPAGVASLLIALGFGIIAALKGLHSNSVQDLLENNR